LGGGGGGGVHAFLLLTPGGNGLASGGGGGAGFGGGAGGAGGLGGGGGGGSHGYGGAGGDFGGGGGTSSSVFNGKGVDGLQGGAGGFGGGGGGAPTDANDTGGAGGFGAGGGGAFNGGLGGTYGGAGGDGIGAGGGGGAALGGAIFVRDGGTLILNDTDFTGSFSVTGGAGGGGSASAGEAHGSVMFLNGTTNTSFDVSAGVTETISTADAIAGDGGFTKTGAGALMLESSDSYTGGTILQAGTLEVAALDAAGIGKIAFAGAARLDIENAALVGHVFDNEIDLFGKHDVLDLTGLRFHRGASATYHRAGHHLKVHSGHITDTLTLHAPHGFRFAVASDHHGGTDVTLAVAHGASPHAVSLVVHEPSAWGSTGDLLFHA
jgi:hypothetical protein